MHYEIQADLFPSLDIHLQPGDTVYSQVGHMAWFKGNVQISSSTRGGLIKGLARSLSGDTLFLTEYSCQKGRGLVTFTTSFPGHILPVSFKAGESRICARTAFMAAESGVEIGFHLRRKLGSSFGGESFVWQRLTGPGLCWMEVAGAVRDYALGPGEILQVQPAHLVMYEATVDHALERVGDIKNMLFGGEGLFLSVLKGPGRVWLQTQPLANLASRLQPYYSDHQKK
jgi:uncharacterized protein (TIGR00266 family)